MTETSGASSRKGKSFVGFGFGPIQSGLFVYEAVRSGNFPSIVIAEVDAGLVRAVRESDGGCQINVAHADGITTERIGPVQLLNPTVAEDRVRLIEAIAAADELATALPSVEFFARGGEASVAALLAASLRQAARPHPQLVYTAENHNHAGEILQAAVADALGRPPPASIQFVNTVIGKMSGVITNESEKQRLGLSWLAPGISRAVLVEEFNRILISRVALPGFQRGLEVFEEKPALLPFEEAKLYGHNAIHALIGYLANARGCQNMADAGRDSGLMAIAREAFLLECGAGLLHRHKGVDDLFTPAGFEAYANDLPTRMASPFLSDPVSRVIRDPQRKLGWDDRLIGAMRLALAAGVQPQRLAAGARLALLHWLRESWPVADRSSKEAGEILQTLSPTPTSQSRS